MNSIGISQIGHRSFACDLRQIGEMQGFGRSICKVIEEPNRYYQNRNLWVDFDRRLKLKFLVSKVTTDAELIAYHELDEVLGLSEMSEEVLTDSRMGSTNSTSLCHCYVSQSTADLLAARMSTTPDDWPSTQRCATWLAAGQRWRTSTLPASTSEISWFDTEILNIDCFVSETYGLQKGSAYNRYFGCMRYHPLFLFNQFGDLERVILRLGNHASAKFWRRVFLPVIERFRDLDIPKFFHSDGLLPIRHWTGY